MSGSDWLREAFGRGPEVTIVEGEDGNATMNRLIRRTAPEAPPAIPDLDDAARDEWRETYELLLANREPEAEPFRGDFDLGPRGQASAPPESMNSILRREASWTLHGPRERSG